MAGVTRRGRVIGRVALTERVTEVTLRIEGGEPFRWLAGQYVKLRPDVPDGEVSYYSIASSPKQAGLDVLTLAVTNSAGLLGHAPLDSMLVIEGPFGELTWRDAPGALLVGAGTGVAPLRALVHDVLADLPGEAGAREPASALVLVAGNRIEADLLWHHELRSLAREHRRFRYEPVVSQPDADWSGRRGYVQDHLREIAETLPAGFRVMTCGTTRMVDDCRRVLAEVGVPPERISSEANS